MYGFIGLRKLSQWTTRWASYSMINRLIGMIIWAYASGALGVRPDIGSSWPTLRVTHGCSLVGRCNMNGSQVATVTSDRWRLTVIGSSSQYISLDAPGNSFTGSPAVYLPRHIFSFFCGWVQVNHLQHGMISGIWSIRSICFSCKHALTMVAPVWGRQVPLNLLPRVFISGRIRTCQWSAWPVIAWSSHIGTIVVTIPWPSVASA